MSGATRLLRDPVWQWAPTRPIPLKTHSDHVGMVCDAHRHLRSGRQPMYGLFSLQGSLNRAKYLLRVLAIAVVVQIAAILGGALVLVSLGEAGQQVAFLMGAIIGLVGGVAMAFEVVKRLHDLDRPGTHFWVGLILIYNIYLGLLLLLKKGIPGPNQYGEDPRAGPQVGIAVAHPSSVH